MKEHVSKKHKDKLEQWLEANPPAAPAIPRIQQ